jgi:glycerophosphoryl diester phosphodiesterase
MPLAAAVPPRIEVHGHRGARALRPENTMAAFEYAIEQGVDALELDLGVTRDDVVVVSHDPILKAPLCKGPRRSARIRELTLSEVRQWDCGAARNRQFPRQQTAPGARVPTLEEVFGLAPRGTFRFNIETKSFPGKPELAPAPARFVELVLGVIRRHRLESRVILQSFDYRTLHEMKRQSPEIALAALYDGRPKDFTAIAREAAADMVSPEHKLATPARVRQAHDAGLRVVAWTANKPAEWDRLIAAGVDGIITDDPAALLAHLRRLRLR